jgi:branched-subunit amino acid transport protein AzlD
METPYIRHFPFLIVVTERNNAILTTISMSVAASVFEVSDLFLLGQNKSYLHSIYIN